MGFYIEVTQTPNRSGFASEDIPAGTAVYLSGGLASLADAAEHETIDGVADTPRRAEYIAGFRHETSDFVYLADDPDPDNHAPLSDNNAHLVPVGGGADGDYIKLKAMADVDGASAPDIGDGDVVGFIDTTVVDGVPDGAGHIVQEGYTDEEDNEYSREEDNFVAVGRVYKDEATEFGQPVRVVVNQKL